MDEALNSTNCLELLLLFKDVAHFGELRLSGLPTVDESRLLDKVRFKFALLTASVVSKQQNVCFRLKHRLI